MFKNAIETVTNGALEAIKRFPLSAICAAALFILAMNFIPELERNITYLLILKSSFFLLISVKLYVESKRLDGRFYYIIGIPAALATSAYILYAPASAFFFLPASFLSIFIAPFLRKEATSQQVWCFNYSLWLHISFTIMCAVILYIGMAAIFASLQFLFGLSIEGSSYFNTWLFVATLFSPVFAMAGIPKDFSIEKEEYPHLIEILKSYISMPLLLVYTLILYGYIAKIIFLWELPKGGVAYMVSAYGAAGILAYLVTYPLTHKPGIISLFSRYFFFLLIAPLVLLAIGICTRLYEYGITEQRYAIMMCLIWLSLSSAFVIFGNREKAPKFIFISLVGLLLFSSFGPWSAAYLSEWSQTAKLEKMLVKNKILVNGKIQKAEEKPSNKEQIQISSIVEYLSRGNKVGRMKEWFSDMPTAYLNKEKKTVNIYSDHYQIMQDMGLTYINSYSYNNRNLDNDIIQFSMRNNWLNQPYINVSDFEYVLNIGYFYDSPSPASATKDILVKKDGKDIKVSTTFDKETNQYIVNVEGRLPLSFELNNILKYQDMDNNASLYGSDNPNLLMSSKNNDVYARVVIENISGKYKKKEQKFEINSLSTKLLLKIIN